MRTLTVGNPASFAIEAGISQALERESQFALGYFVIRVSGRAFGVKAPDATCLGCSFGEVARRIRERGRHVAPFAGAAARTIVDAHCRTAYDLVDREHEAFLGMSSDNFQSLMLANHIVWAPDGDEAFDDGGNVLQFDVDSKVRLIAFMNTNDRAERAASVTEQWLDAGVYYSVLEEWLGCFDRLRAGMLRSPKEASFSDPLLGVFCCGHVFRRLAFA